MSAPHFLEKFVEKVLEEKGMGAVQPEVYTQLKNDLMGRAQTIVDATVLRHLPDNKIPEFEKLLDDDATEPAALEQFCHTHIPNLDEIIAAALVNFRARYLGDLAASQ